MRNLPEWRDYPSVCRGKEFEADERVLKRIGLLEQQAELELHQLWPEVPIEIGELVTICYEARSLVISKSRVIRAEEKNQALLAHVNVGAAGWLIERDEGSECVGVIDVDAFFYTGVSSLGIFSSLEIYPERKDKVKLHVWERGNEELNQTIIESDGMVINRLEDPKGELEKIGIRDAVSVVKLNKLIDFFVRGDLFGPRTLDELRAEIAVSLT